MGISCTTRSLLGCIWEFASTQQGLAFASASLAFNEVLPLVLMVCTSLATLHALVKHIKAVVSSGQSGGFQVELDKLLSTLSTDHKAAHLITLLVSQYYRDDCLVLKKNS